jgi:hypothetical protein
MLFAFPSEIAGRLKAEALSFWSGQKQAHGHRFFSEREVDESHPLKKQRLISLKMSGKARTDRSIFQAQSVKNPKIGADRLIRLS